MNVLDTAIQLILVSDNVAGGIVELTGETADLQKIWMGDAPPKTPSPYVIWRPVSNVPTYTFGNTVAFNNTVHAIQGFAADTPEKDGVTAVGEIADRLEVLFLNAALTVAGKTLMCCRPLAEISFGKERDDTNDRWLYSRGWLIESWLTQS